MRSPLPAAIALVLFTLAIAIFGRVTDIGTVRVTTGAAVEVRDLVFKDGPTGTIHITDARNGAVVEVVESGEDGFIRGSMRGLARERTRHGVGPEVPFRLIRWESGVVSISDTGTGQRIYLDAFGPTNVAAFTRLFASEGGR